jgi:hypothetical protein
MKPATVHEIKQELATLPASALMDLCLRLAKFKKDNKELLTYLLFDASDEAAFIGNIKKEMDLEFDDLPKSNHYLTKKTLRKILRGTAKQIRYMGSAEAEVELLTHFCSMVRRRRIPIESSTVMNNLYRQQVKKIKAAIATMHEDLQYDYLKDLKGLD